MKFSLIASTLALLATQTLASPTAHNEARQAPVEITFIGSGAGNEFYTVTAPTDGSFFYTNNYLSISKIRSSGGAYCYFYGTEGSFTTVIGATTSDVGPPQPQYGGYCYAFQ